MSRRRKSPRPPSPPQATKEITPTTQDALAALADVEGPLPSAALVPGRINKIVKQTNFQGPIPHPEIFRQYGEVIPDAPERILRVFEQDSAHVRAIQFAALTAQKEDNRRVHWMAWSLVAGGYLASFGFAAFDKDWLAGITLTTTIAATITGFLQSWKAGKDAGREADKEAPKRNKDLTTESSKQPP